MKKQPTKGALVKIPVSSLEFNVDGNTIWVHDCRGGTAFRIKTSGKIKVDVCKNSPLSHGDLLVEQDI